MNQVFPAHPLEIVMHSGDSGSPETPFKDWNPTNLCMLFILMYFRTAAKNCIWMPYPMGITHVAKLRFAIYNTILLLQLSFDPSIQGVCRGRCRTITTTQLNNIKEKQ